MHKIWIGVAAAAVAVTTTAACGSTAAKTTATTAKSNAGGAAVTASTCLSTAKQATAAAEGEDQPNFPTATVDAARAKGKTVWMIQSTVTPLVTDVTSAFDQAASVAGVKTKIINGNGSVNTTVQAASEAVAQHAGALVLFAVPVTEVQAEITAAKAAGIPVIDTFDGDTGQNMTAQGVYGHVSEDPLAAGKTVADWMLTYTSCHLDTAILGASVVTPHALSAKGAEGEISRLSPTSKATFVNLDLTTLATSAGSQAQETLRRDPNVNVLMSCFDGAVPLITAGMNQSGGGSKVKIISMDGAAAEISLIRSGNSPLVADVALPPAGYIGWAYMDQALRALTGAAPADGVLPYRLIDKTNVGSTSTDLFPAFANYQAQFKHLWGVTA
jgi:ribose transport system substrate-binding protein